MSTTDTIVVTKQQLLDFVNTQSDDRPIDFNQNESFEECGCLMVHYGKEVLCKSLFTCDNSRWWELVSKDGLTKANFSKGPIAILEKDYLIFFDIVRNSLSIKTYGELKKNLRE